MTLRIHPPTEAQLLAAAQMCAPGHGAALAHLRWHARTPYAEARVAVRDGQVLGWCTAVAFGATARVAQVMPVPAPGGIGRALAADTLALLEAQGATTITVQSAPEHAEQWSALGFAAMDRFVRYAGGRFTEAQRDEVVLLEPVHTLALLHQHRRATGEDHAPLLLEHRMLAQGYVEQGVLRGALLPVLGHGLVIADAPAIGLELQRWLLPVQAHVVVPAANDVACAHLLEQGYRPAGGSIRLVRGVPPQFRPERVFAWPW